MAIRSDLPATILIADDNPILLQGLERALRAHGHAVATASDGVAVLETLAHAPELPVLLLLDVMMPGMSGLDVLRTLRAEARWAHLPVVLITAATDEALPDSARQYGAVDVLIKPFRLNELLERIDVHVQQHRQGVPREPMASPDTVAP